MKRQTPALNGGVSAASNEPVPAERPSRRSAAARQRLIEAAERLFDEQGLDRPSARAIAAAAGHGNTGAVLYHFGDRDTLTREVCLTRLRALDPERHALLDTLEASGSVTPRAALEAVMTPLVHLLRTPAGRRGIRVVNQALHHPNFYADAVLGLTDSTARGAAYVIPLAGHLPPHQRRQRARTVLVTAISLLSAQSQVIDRATAAEPLIAEAEFLDDLVNVLFAIAAAP
jgi:AcrR family transcriptional regulator